MRFPVDENAREGSAAAAGRLGLEAPRRVPAPVHADFLEQAPRLRERRARALREAVQADLEGGLAGDLQYDLALDPVDEADLFGQAQAREQARTRVRAAGENGMRRP
jgi:hypothetical protein